ncbi:MAG: DHH family phosphoesterase [Clostridia bacterium]
MTREEFLCEFRRIVNRYTKFVISGHIKPDGDSVGACVALALFLKGLDKTVCVVYDGASERYAEVAALAPSFEPGEGYEVARGEFVFIMLDCCEPKRTGGAQGFFDPAVTSLCIDHHVGGEAYAMYHYVEDTASSTCEILYSLFKQEGIEVTADMAKALFLGVAFDTGGFRHSSTTADTFRMAAELKETGVDSTKDHQQPISHPRI